MEKTKTAILLMFDSCETIQPLFCLLYCAEKPATTLATLQGYVWQLRHSEFEAASTAYVGDTNELSHMDGEDSASLHIMILLHTHPCNIHICFLFQVNSTLYCRKGKERTNSLTVSLVEACKRRETSIWQVWFILPLLQPWRKGFRFREFTPVIDEFWWKGKQKLYNQLLFDPTKASDEKYL